MYVGGHLAGTALLRTAAASGWVAPIHAIHFLVTCCWEDRCTSATPLPHHRLTISARKLLHRLRKGTACSLALRMKGAAFQVAMVLRISKAPSQLVYGPLAHSQPWS